jgi:hypothetical protein
MPADIDRLILFNCSKSGADEIARKFRDNGVSVIHILTYDFAGKNETEDAKFFEKWQKSTDQVLLTATLPYERTGQQEQIASTTIPLNGLEYSESNEFRSEVLNWGIFVGNAEPDGPDGLANQAPHCFWLNDNPTSLPDYVRAFYTNDSLCTLASNLKNYCLFVPDEVLTELDSYEQMLLEEDALRFSNVIVPYSHMQEISSRKQVTDRFRQNFEKRQRASVGQHPKARALHIQNLVLSVDIRKKIAELRGQESARDVKAIVMVNSQAIAGSENYGLLVTKGLFNLGMDVRFCTPSAANVYLQGLKTSREWLESRNLPAPIQANYGHGHAM